MDLIITDNRTLIKRFVSDTARGLINVLADSILRKNREVSVLLKQNSIYSRQILVNRFNTIARWLTIILEVNLQQNEHNFLFNIDMNGELETGRLGAAINIDNYFLRIARQHFTRISF